MAKINVNKDFVRIKELIAKTEEQVIDHVEFTGEDASTTVSEFYDEDGLCLLTVVESPNITTFSFHLFNEEYELKAVV